MIKVTKNGQKIDVVLVTGASKNIILHFDAGNELFAELLANRLEEYQSKHVSYIRQSAYNAGWRDKSNKKTAKNTQHSSSVTSTEYYGNK